MDDEDQDTGNRHCQAGGNAGMADVIAKMLSKPVPESQSVILTKKRKSKESTEAKAEAKRLKLAAAAHRDWEEQHHVLPDLARDEVERRLQSIAMKGVVKLFNAVSKQQKETKSKLEAAPTEAKREKVMSTISQDHFLEMLRGGNAMVAGPAAHKKKSATEESSPATTKKTKSSASAGKEADADGSAPWRVLQDNFMMGAKMKDWDKDRSSEEDEASGYGDDDDSSGSD